ncbi:M23 family metallopeptidase [Paraburkholderia acidisoli]|uniref:Peptidoglycan DD-metalloendopeptidase family protein n=1 Tax=Paraburkholderia acidisoli TaxID=2571748 RepID=A0A7Z2JGL6_9BURK|nr:M23 family metallopeptidase [Paraburkholderia acidisoli]QGZ63861.1 peptidoglycan DD-metalloendopeptidase family protein [Paraburkholderia acidisoli]
MRVAATSFAGVAALLGVTLALSACTITPWRTSGGDTSQASPGAGAKGTPLSVETSPVPVASPVVVAPIGGANAGAERAAGTSGLYRVKPGDTLYRVAKAHNQRPADVASWNKLPTDAKIQTGQLLRVAPPVVAGAASAAAVAPVAKAAATSAPSNAASVAPKVAVNSAKAEPKAEPRAEVKAEVKARTEARSPRFVWPIEGSVAQPFTAKSKGVVIAGPAGQDVRAVAPGRVVYAGSGIKSYGRLVIVKHDAHLITAYGRNGKLLVKQGDAVKQGEVIAASATDSAGKATLVFEMREDGKPVDPLSQLPR